MEYKCIDLHKGKKTYYPKTVSDLREWLKKYGEFEKSVWIILYKKNSNKPSLTVGEVVKHCLCFGWVDSKTNTKDTESYYLYISQRNPKSNWSAINKSNIANLEVEGLIDESGYRLIEIAKKTGTWDALNDVDNLIIPKDLDAELQKIKGAKENFLAFNKSSRRGILEWIFNAKKPETRANRIVKTAKLAGENKRAFFS